MHAVLLWTINDFPAYANLSGWSTKGKYACPCCNSEIESCWLSNGKKHSYGGHRRWLPDGHRFRKDGKILMPSVNLEQSLKYCHRAGTVPQSLLERLRRKIIRQIHASLVGTFVNCITTCTYPSLLYVYKFVLFIP